MQPIPEQSGPASAPKKRDWIPIVISCCLVLSCLGWFLYKNDIYRESTKHRSGESIGRLEKKSERVKLRSSNAFLWNDVSAHSDIFARDSIQTGRDSMASLSFNDGGSLHMGPESLIYLSDEKGKLKLDIAEGDLHLQGAFSARIGGKDISSSSDATEVNISQSKSGSLRVETQSGEVNIQINGNNEKVQTGQALEAAAGAAPTIKELSYKFNKPMPFEEFRSELKEYEIQIEAESLKITSDDVQNYILEISKEKNFKTPFRFPWLAQNTSFKVKLEEGLWHARIINQSDKAAESSIRSFQVVRLPSLSWRDIAGQSSLLVRVLKNKLQYSIAWQSIPQISKYRLSILGKDEKIAFVTETKQNFIGQQSNLGEYLEKSWENVKEDNQGWNIKLEALDEDDKPLVAAISGQLQIVDQRPAPKISKLTRVDLDTKNMQATFELTSTDEIRAGTKITYVLLGQERQQETMRFSVPMKLLAKHAESYGASLELQLVANNGQKSMPFGYKYNADEMALPLLIEEKARLIYPSQASRIQENSSITLSWNNDSNSFYSPEKYIIRINKQTGTKNRTLEYESKINSLKIGELQPGKYTWEVESHWANNKVSPASNASDFEVIGATIFTAPTPIRSPAQQEDN